MLGPLLWSCLMWLHSTCSWGFTVLCCRWQLLLEGDREKTVSYSILTSPNLSLSPPDKRAGLLAMMSSGRIWKVRVS